MAELKTATDELRHLLEKRRIEWKEPNDATRYFKTTWRVGSWEYKAIETFGGQFSVHAEHHYWLTPAQVVEATLGRKTCESVVVDCNDGLIPPFIVYCSACGAEWGFTPRFCPNCGREVISG